MEMPVVLETDNGLSTHYARAVAFCGMPLPALEDHNGWNAFVVYGQSLSSTNVRCDGLHFDSALIDFFANATSSDARLSFDIGKSRTDVTRASEPRSSAEMLVELRNLLGYSWEDIAQLLSVDRRSIYNWVSGNEVRRSNHEKIREVLETVRCLDRGIAEINRAVIEYSAPDCVPLRTMIIAGEHQLVREIAGRAHGQARPAGTAVDKEWTRNFGRRSLESSFPDSSLEIIAVNKAPAKSIARRTVRRK
jgi:transcriptional regulator with XRE-family HTH domain